MAAIPPLSWTCPQCSQTFPASQENCPNCAGVGNPPPPTPRPSRSRQTSTSSAGPSAASTSQPQRAPATPSPQAHGGNLQYQQMLTGVSVDRNENLINHNWYKFLLWMLVLGGLALLAWLFYGEFLWGWHANPCKSPCVAAPAVITTHTAPARPAAPRPSPAPRPAAAKPTPAPVDLSPVERGLNRIADSISRPAAEPTRMTDPRPTPQELDEETARWLEGQRDP